VRPAGVVAALDSIAFHCVSRFAQYLRRSFHAFLVKSAPQVLKRI
jgi:hypothetical protein